MSAVLVEGELAIYRAVEFKDRLLAALSAAGEVEVDLSQVNEMDSAGVQLLLLTRREAMASGKPVVASNIEGYATVITDGVEGRLVEPKNAEAFALALVHVLADSEMAARMAARGKVRADEYGWDRIAQRELSYYERLLYEHRLAKQSRDRREALAAES